MDSIFGTPWLNPPQLNKKRTGFTPMEWDKKIPLGRRGKLCCSSKFNGAGRFLFLLDRIYGI
jgi:hypothetical protein